MGKILVIDDSPEFCRMISIIFQRHGFETMQALGGTPGIQMAIREQPDLILLDYMMPDKDGWEVYAELSGNPDTVQIPVIMITAFAGDIVNDRARALQMGMVDFLTKPVSLKELVARVQELLAIQRLSGPERPRRTHSTGLGV